MFVTQQTNIVCYTNFQDWEGNYWGDGYSSFTVFHIMVSLRGAGVSNPCELLPLAANPVPVLSGSDVTDHKTHGSDCVTVQIIFQISKREKTMR